ncbi:hypothetical protein PVK06_043867 [Gossypium arboreum]|uniref:Uncharacterized protein n=1 Tax=Gossypium arboreum TaxID=29729 RepID=A0ABR0MPJ7_GOSAR|nr:hypothetical protein PVK06_043867 [Gossypium arboreum]
MADSSNENYLANNHFMNCLVACQDYHVIMRTIMWTVMLRTIHTQQVWWAVQVKINLRTHEAVIYMVVTHLLGLVVLLMHLQVNPSSKNPCYHSQIPKDPPLALHHY